MTTVRRSQPKTLPVEALDGTSRKLRRVLQGKENFTGIQVEGQRVEEFLSKTDGEKLVDASGLDAGVVETPAIAVEAVTASGFDYVAAIVDGKTTSPVVLATVVLTVESGDRVDLLGNCSIASVGGSGAPAGAVPQTGIIAIHRDGISLPASERYATVVIFEVGIGLSATTAISDEPGDGTFTYTLVSTLSGTSGVTAYDLSNRYLVATRVKR